MTATIGRLLTVARRPTTYQESLVLLALAGVGVVVAMVVLLVELLR